MEPTKQLPGNMRQNCAYGRRRMLQSAAAAMGVSLLALQDSGGTTLTSGSISGLPRPGSASQEDATPAFTSKMMGFMLPHEQFRIPQLLEFGEAAEKAGFDLLANSDHLQPWQSNEGHAGMAWVTMAAVGQRTKRVWMGPAVTCPTFRYNPAVVAEGFASLNLLYPGRIFLGIGSGEALNEQAAIGSWPKWQERSERLIEAADVIRQLWKGQQVSHKGKYYEINARLYDPPQKQIPLLMAANGPKAMRRAGQYADGLITDPKTWKQYKSEFENGARAAGKDLSKMPVLVEQYVVVGDQSEARAAAELWRFGPKAFKEYYNIRDPQTIQQRADKEIPLEKVYEEWPIGTDPSVHLKTINELFQSGATIVNVHSGQADQKKVIDFYGKEVLPRLRNVLGRKDAEPKAA
jgi:TAT-translocated FGD2 family F420-dependent dehydrogenase